MSDYYVRTYNTTTDTDEWHGPFSAHMAGLVAMGLPRTSHARVYHKSELPGFASPDGGVA